MILSTSQIVKKKCDAQGLTDYSLPMPNGYEFSNTPDTVIRSPNGWVIFSPSNLPQTGPIQEFAATDSFIFLRTIGCKSRNLGDDNTPNGIDEKTHLYYVIRTDVDSVAGPYSYKEFQNLPVVRSQNDLNWRTAKNPAGLIMFGCFGACVVFLLSLIIVVKWLNEPRHASVDLLD